MSTPALDIGKLEVAVEDGGNRLEEAAESLYKATLRFEKAEAAWEKLVLLAEAKLIVDAERKGERIPGERTRLALIMQVLGGDDEYLEYVAAKAENNALDKRYRALAAAVNARQSLLRRMQ